MSCFHSALKARFSYCWPQIRRLFLRLIFFLLWSRNDSSRLLLFVTHLAHHLSICLFIFSLWFWEFFTPIRWDRVLIFIRFPVFSCNFRIKWNEIRSYLFEINKRCMIIRRSSSICSGKWEGNRARESVIKIEEGSISIWNVPPFKMNCSLQMHLSIYLFSFVDVFYHPLIRKNHFDCDEIECFTNMTDSLVLSIYLYVCDVCVCKSKGKNEWTNEQKWKRSSETCEHHGSRKNKEKAQEFVTNSIEKHNNSK